MGSVGLDPGFLGTRDGMFKLIELIVSLLVLILTAASEYWLYRGGAAMAYVVFAGTFSFVTLLISLLIYFLKLYNLPLCGRLPWKMMEIVYGGLCAVLFIVGVGIAGNRATIFKSFEGNFHGLFSASAVFCAVAVVVFALHSFLILRGSPPRSAESHARSEANVPT